jgi:hypothetical protein
MTAESKNTDPTPQATDQQPTTDPASQQPTAVAQTEEPVERSKYDLVIRESMARKERIRELEEHQKQFSALTPEGKTVEEQLASLQTQIKGLTEQNQKLQHLGVVRDAVVKMGAIDPKVAALAYEDVKAAGVLGSEELTNAFLSDWKKSNASFFKEDKPQTSITQPLPSQLPKTQDPPREMTPEDEIAKYKSLPVQERAKLGPAYLQDLLKKQAADVANRMRGGK